MELKTDLLKLLPQKSELFCNISNKLSSEKILDQIFEKFNNISNQNSNWKSSLEFLDILLDFFHLNLHMGEWHAVDTKLRKSFSVVSYFKVLALISANQTLDEEILDECAYILDMAIMLGDKLLQTNDEEIIDILPAAAKLLSLYLGKTRNSQENPKKRLKIEQKYTEEACNISIVEQPSIDCFLTNYYKPQIPTLIKNAMNHWPALEKWQDLNYLISKAGIRTVPVELGSQYTNENWSQNLIKFSDFIRNHIVTTKETNTEGESSSSKEDIVYLAQHDLFDQIPELKEDICQPEYILDQEPRIKAWFGPKGTISPLHTDPTHNLLCQVLGSKKIILASPNDTEKLYPHDHFILNNTSQIDAENLDYEKFPLCKDVKFYSLVLQHGDILYMPPKWWHHVRSLSPSFSVSYWFD